jgi:two-component system response regulator
MITGTYALLAEDDTHTVQLVEEILAQHNPRLRTVHVTDGEQVMDYLHGRGRFDGRDPRPPAVILLDLEMPRADGLEVLRALKHDPLFHTVPVVVLAGVSSDAKVTKSYELGANAFVVKPVNTRQFTDLVRTLGDFWLTINEPPRVAPARP